MMRGFGQCLFVVCVAAGTLVGARPARVQTPAASPVATATADQILAAAHAALGGDKLDAVKTFVVTGRTRRLQGSNLVPIEFEIACELPDKYVRKDEVPAQENDPTSRGFNGDKLIQIPAPAAPPAGARAAGPMPGAAGATSAGTAPAGMMPPGRAGAPMSPPSPTTSVKQDFARLTLGMFAKSFDSYPLTFTYIGQAETPQGGKADVLEVKGAANFQVRLFVNSATHLPVMIGWTQPRTPAQVVITVPGQPKPSNLPAGAVVMEGPAAPGASATPADKEAYTKAVQALQKDAMARPVEYWMFYADYRASETPTFPHRMRRAVGGDTTEETTFDQFQVNAKINPKKFEPVK